MEDDERMCESPLPGADSNDDSDVDAPSEAHGSSRAEAPVLKADECGAAAELDASNPSMVVPGLADEVSRRQSADGCEAPLALGDVSTLLPEEEVLSPVLGKRREESGEHELAGKRSRHDAPTAAAPTGALVFTAPDGTKISVPKKTAMKQTVAAARGDERLLKEDIFQLEHTVARRRKMRAESAAADAAKVMEHQADDRSKKSHMFNMLVESYRPKSFVNLLSDERVNRSVLLWLKEWDPVVFGTRNGEKASHADIQLPEHKILLLYGPPGSGKTTLAHVLARQAGYCPAEINASDERSTNGLANRLDALASMRASFTDGRPNCIIMDEIDGCLGAEGQGATDILLKYCRDSAAAESSRDSKRRWRSGGAVGGGNAAEDEDDAEDAATAALRGDGRIKVKDRAAKKRKKKEEPKMLQRPIICICNDLYVPALRGLRKEAKLVKMAEPTAQRLVGRLKLVCEKENIKAERQALTMLHELHTGDIRSCLNALQMLAVDGRTIDVSRIREQSAAVRDSKGGGLFDVWTSVFRVAGAQGGGAAKKMPEFKDDALAHLRLILKRHFSDMGLILQGCHHNYLKVKYTDSCMLKTAKCLEELAESDVIAQQIAAHQHWSLSPYLQLGCLNFHVECAAPQMPRIEFPRRLGEISQARKANSNVWDSMVRAMPPDIRQQVGSRSLLPLEVAPQLKYILRPVIKMQNMHLMSALDKARLEAHAGIMALMGLRYHTSHESGAQDLVLDPAIDKLVTFESGASDEASPMSQELIKYLDFQAKQLLLRKREARQGMGVSTPPTATRSSLKSTSSKVVGMAGWGNSSSQASSVHKKRPPTACSNTHAVRYKFAQGLTNAIKRPVTMKDLLGSV